jgi:K+-transporting ATPase ATPase C chain
MNTHLRANLWLLGMTVVLCCILYPLTLWAIGQSVFADKASGSLIVKDGETVGSRLIAQPFNAPEYFQPRPSAAAYNASASGGSNYGASNPKLRARVAQALGPIVKYRNGPNKDRRVGADIERWFREDRFRGEAHLVAQWAKAYSFAAQDWVRTDALHGDCVRAWQNAHPREVEAWRRDNAEIADPRPEDLAVPFFVSFSHAFPGTWPGVVETQSPDGKPAKRIEPVTEDTNIQANFFDMWLRDHPGVELAEVPADLVMASGSGLDPHITRKNARYQLDRVVDAWAKKTGAPPDTVRKAIETLLDQNASAPLGGLAGVELINVLEVNLALPGVMKGISKETGGNGGPA